MVKWTNPDSSLPSDEAIDWHATLLYFYSLLDRIYQIKVRLKYWEYSYYITNLWYSLYEKKQIINSTSTDANVPNIVMYKKQFFSGELKIVFPGVVNGAVA